MLHRCGWAPLRWGRGLAAWPTSVQDPAPILVTGHQVKYLIERLYIRAGLRARVPPGALVHALRHTFAYVDDETYRRDIKGVRNLQEGRHSLAAAIFHGRKGELYQRYQRAWRTSWERSGWSSTACCCGTPST